MKKSKPVQSSAGKKIMQGMEEALAWSRGEDVPVRSHHISLPPLDVKAARQKLGLSQNQFAAAFGIPAATLRGWEYGRRQPEGPARILLAVIEARPEVVRDVISTYQQPVA